MSTYKYFSFPFFCFLNKVDIEISFNIPFPSENYLAHFLGCSHPTLETPVSSSSLSPSLPNQSLLQTGASRSLWKCGFDQVTAPPLYPMGLGEKVKLLPRSGCFSYLFPFPPLLSPAASAMLGHLELLGPVTSGTSTQYSTWPAPSHPSGPSSNAVAQRSQALPLT